MRTLLLAAAVAAGLALASAAGAQTACPEGRPVAGDLGIERFRCVGGACEIWVRSPRGLTHVFTTEPRVDRLDPNGPAAGVLEEGDVIVAVDGLLITSAAGGWRLANIEPGTAVSLWVRRGGRDLRVEILTVPGCSPRGLSVRIPGVP